MSISTATVSSTSAMVVRSFAAALSMTSMLGERRSSRMRASLATTGEFG